MFIISMEIMGQKIVILTNPCINIKYGDLYHLGKLIIHEIFL